MHDYDIDSELFSSSKKDSVPDEFIDISSFTRPEAEVPPPPPEPPVQKPHKKRRKKHHYLRNTVLILLCLAVLLSGGAYWYAYKTLDQIKRVPLDTDDLGITSDNYAEVKNIALLGVDSREDTLKGRSDAVVILSINKSAKRINLVSIARDSRVQIEGHGQDKLTHAYAYGRSQLAVKTLNQNFGLEITDYITMNFFGLSRAIDAAGGVTVDIDQKEMEEMNRNIIPYMVSEMGIPCDPIQKPGKQHVSGSQAVSYSRIRHIDSDIERGNRQKEVLTALFDSLKKSNPFKALQIVTDMLGECETSLSTKTLLHTGIWALFAKPEWEQLSIPNDDIPSSGGIIGGVWYFSYDLKEARKALQDFLLEE